MTRAYWVPLQPGAISPIPLTLRPTRKSRRCITVPSLGFVGAPAEPNAPVSIVLYRNYRRLFVASGAQRSFCWQLAASGLRCLVLLALFRLLLRAAGLWQFFRAGIAILVEA